VNCGLKLRIARVYIPRRQYVERRARESEKYGPSDWDSLCIEVRSIRWSVLFLYSTIQKLKSVSTILNSKPSVLTPGIEVDLVSTVFLFIL
jgi:hypothetical protein